MNVENQRKAYEFVKSLHNDTTKTNMEKAQVFNLKMLDWAKREGKNIGDSVINCLRELAVNAIKSETTKD